MKAIDGCFFHFQIDEWKSICTMLQEEGYAPDPSGLKKFIIDISTDKDEKNTGGIADKFAEFLEQNPDAVNFYAGAARQVINRIKKKWRL